MLAHSSNDNLSEHLSMGIRKIQELEEDIESREEIEGRLRRENESLRRENKSLKEGSRDDLDTYYIIATNLPDCANEGMLKSLFGQHGPVDNIWHIADMNLAIIDYKSTCSAQTALSYSRRNGIKLKSLRLGITPLVQP